MQVKQQPYPNLLLLAKYHDMHTPYWDIAEATIAYRSLAENDPLILMNTDFNAGHMGNVQPYVSEKYEAQIYAFILYTIESGENNVGAGEE